MKAGPALLSLALLGACGGDKAPAADNQSMPVANAVIVPIDNGVIDSDSEIDNLAAPETPQPKPLVSRGTSPRPAPPDYRSIGTEPFWAVTVRGSTATLERPDKPPIRYAISRNDDARAIRYLGEGFAMTATEGPCSDGMSDVIWSDRVQLSFGEGTLKGCGGERDDGGYEN